MTGYAMWLAGIILQTARIYSGAPGKVLGWRSAVGAHCKFILLNDFTCRETRLHNADWFIRMITLGSIQRYAV